MENQDHLTTPIEKTLTIFLERKIKTMTEQEKQLKQINEKLDNLQKKVDTLAEDLYKHIKFIDKTYEGLRNPIDAAKKWLGR